VAKKGSDGEPVRQCADQGRFCEGFDETHDSVIGAQPTGDQQHYRHCQQ
jgi:hypothetical protein